MYQGTHAVLACFAVRVFITVYCSMYEEMKEFQARKSQLSSPIHTVVQIENSIFTVIHMGHLATCVCASAHAYTTRTHTRAHTHAQNTVCMCMSFTGALLICNTYRGMY